MSKGRPGGASAPFPSACSSASSVLIRPISSTVADTGTISAWAVSSVRLALGERPLGVAEDGAQVVGQARDRLGHGARVL